MEDQLDEMGKGYMNGVHDTASATVATNESGNEDDLLDFRSRRSPLSSKAHDAFEKKS